MTDTLLVIFIGILAIAILMQSVLFLLMFLNLRKLIKDLLPQIQKLAEQTEATFSEIKDIAENIRPVAQKLADSAEIIHGRVVEVDGFVGEIVQKSRREIAEIEDTLHVVTKRVQDSINILSDNVIMPINRINALTKAVQVAIGVLFRRQVKEKANENAASADSSEDTIFF